MKKYLVVIDNGEDSLLTDQECVEDVITEFNENNGDNETSVINYIYELTDVTPENIKTRNTEMSQEETATTLIEASRFLPTWWNQ